MRNLKDIISIALVSLIIMFTSLEVKGQDSGITVYVINEFNNNVTWDAMDNADEYHLEWTFVDDYALNGGHKPLEEIYYNFKNNNSRIVTKDNSYSLIPVFESGYVIYRVRSVKYEGENKQPVYGDWLGDIESGKVEDLLPKNYFHSKIPHESDRKNWQYVIDFAEEGRTQESVNYMDGTMKQRQQVSANNTANVSNISETIYDHLGRPAIEIPSTPGSLLLESGLDYKKKFNTNTARKPYHWLDFDLGQKAAKMNTESGANQYFSSNSKSKNSHRDYLPNAYGYAFSQTEYTQEPTGRLKRKGSLGETHQLDSGNETKYYYGVPSQDELDRVFGNHIGYAENYKRNMVVDPNGQVSVSYLDANGNIVATALAGKAPKNLIKLPSNKENKIVLNLIEEGNQLDFDNNALRSSKTFTVERDNQEYSFGYRLKPADFKDEWCTNSFTQVTNQICYDCIYDLKIKLVDQNGTEEIITEETIGSLDATCDTAQEDYIVSKTIVLNMGPYTITKELKVNEASIEKYMKMYEEKNESCFNEWKLDIIGKRSKDSEDSDCELTCQECQERLAEANAIDTNSVPIEIVDGELQTPGYNKSHAAKLKAICDKLCLSEENEKSTCNIAYEAMLIDMSPAGQYAKYYKSENKQINVNLFPLSILNPENKLPNSEASWKKPITPYLDENGNRSKIKIDTKVLPHGLPSHDETKRDSQGYIEPQDLDYPEDFMKYWKDSWAESLVGYHPEYGYYEWCQANSTFDQYDAELMKVNTFDEAVEKGFIKNGDNTNLPFYDNDPFFSNEDYKNKFNNKGYPKRVTDEAMQSVYCTTFAPKDSNDPDISNEALLKCIASHTKFGEGTTEQDDKEWISARMLYLGYKQRYIDEIRRDYIRKYDKFDNTGIGYGQEMDGPWKIDGEYPYKDKVKHFIFEDDVKKMIEGRSGINLDNINEISDSILNKCDKCPIAVEFELLLKKIIWDGQIEKKTNIKPYMPYAPNVFEAWGLGYSAYEWEPYKYFNGVGFGINGDGTRIGNIIITAYDTNETIDWSEVRDFSNLIVSYKYRDPGMRYFTMTLEVESTRGVISEIEAFGAVEKVKLDNCLEDASCDGCRGYSSCSGSYGLDLLRFTKYLFNKKRFLQTNLTLLKDGKRVPAYSEKLSGYNFDQEAEHIWQYKNDFESRGFTGKITMINEGPDEEGRPDRSCDFAFYLSDKSIGAITDNITIESIRPYIDPNNPDEEKVFVLTGINENGQYVEIIGNSNCYFINPDCPTTDMCDITPTGTIIPEYTCNLELKEASKSQANMQWDYEMKKFKAALRENYIKQCLGAVEKFTADYNDNLYHFTLFYYNQANQLVRTIPPAGVQPIDLDDIPAGKDISNRDQIEKYRKKLTKTPMTAQNSLPSIYEYNTINSVVRSYNRDAFSTKYWYDELGRIVASQDTEQARYKKYKYVLYDALGRVYESGEIKSLTSLTTDISRNISHFIEWMEPNLLEKTQITKTFYDKPISDEVNNHFGNNGQQFLRKRIATIAYYEVGAQVHDKTRTYDYATHYNYDIHGNVSTLIQENVSLRGINQSLKKISYEYDLISGNVKQVNYQSGESDQFYHRYEYDADNRLAKVSTSTNGTDWEKDANYKYYDHGPLARVELGDNLQGIDYAYTLQGWLKGVNSATLTKDRDPGKDAVSGNRNASFAPDAFGFALSYNRTDYNPIGTISDPFRTVAMANEKGLYNGNIKTMTTGISKFMENTEFAQAIKYEYDQLNRLSKTNTYRISDRYAGKKNGYELNSFYDPNGNITRLLRYGSNGVLMDNLYYRYQKNSKGVLMNNKLRSVYDHQSKGEDVGDIRPGQPYISETTTSPYDNYKYNYKGQLTYDKQEGINSIQWNIFDKVNKVINKNGTTITFAYDALGNRISKTVKNNAETRTTHYIRDASGQTMAIYEQVGTDFKLIEQPIYGADRLGARKDIIDLN